MEEDAADGLRSVTDSILTDTEPDGAENDPYGRIGYPRPRHRTPVHARDPAIGSVLTRSEERVQRVPGCNRGQFMEPMPPAYP